MNERGVEVLTRAALAGVPQWFGDVPESMDIPGALCAVLVLDVEHMAAGDACGFFADHFGLALDAVCPMCDFEGSEQMVIIHMNDGHHADFLTIARKLGGSEPAAGETP